MASEDSPSTPEPGSLLVFSKKPPEEARIFGLRASDIMSIRAPTKEETPVSPEEWGFTSTNQDGVCKYCQLMLHPKAPKVIMHRPNVQTLIDSTCQFCGWLEVSIAQGLPRIAQRYQQGDPALCDPSSTTEQISLSLYRTPTYTRVVPVVGQRSEFADGGLPLVCTTTSQLGDLASRRFWRLYNDKNDDQPHERLMMLKNWLSECSNHENCSTSLSTARGTKLPTRVLDLTGSEDIPSDLGDIKIKLRETSKGDVGSYTALSYCWGSDPQYHFKTTRQTLDQYKQGIDYGSLPLTQQEAILATLYLGIRYLWIDSICIVQDDPEDWQIEAARMSSVYSNSFLTLAATSSDSPQDGLLGPFSAASCVSIHGETVMLRLETHETIDKTSEPLNTRGWTLQEAVLSPRAVCFGREQWLWKCPSRYATEDGFIDRPRNAHHDLNQWASMVLQDPGDDGKNYFKQWYQLVSNYSKRRLTYQSDKLKAVAGLADAFAKLTGYQYVAGLWKEDLAAGLMWQATSRGVNRHTSGVPTWSWASVEGEVLLSDFSKASAPMLKLLDAEQHWEGVPLSSNLKLARLTVSGRMLRVTLGQRSLTQKLRHHLTAVSSPEEIVGETFLDNTFPVEQGISSLWCLLVYVVQEEKGKLENFVLLLTPAPGESGKDGIDAYRRVGIGIIWEKSRLRDTGDEGNETFTNASDTSVVLL